LDTSPLSDTSFANIFSHSVSCLLVLSTVSFAEDTVSFGGCTTEGELLVLWLKHWEFCGSEEEEA